MSVFGALNRFISRLDAESPIPKTGPRRGAAGFQVLRNQNEAISIEPWFDFIVGINGRYIDNPDPNLFSTEVRNCAGSSVSLSLWNAKGQAIRDIRVPIPQPLASLGITLQWTPLLSTDDVWHILDIIPSSPADHAGLLPYGDYIIGTPEGIVRGEAGLGELVEDFLGRPLRLYVYNHEYNVTRLVTITPSRGWGGEGALGCVLGYGALHHLPAPLAEPLPPGDTLFETARFSNEKQRSKSASPTRLDPSPEAIPLSSPGLLVPASMSTPPPLVSPSSAVTSRAPRRARQGASPQRAFDEYWEESEKRSREEDLAPKGKGDHHPPPPLNFPTATPSELGSEPDSRPTEEDRVASVSTSSS